MGQPTQQVNDPSEIKPQVTASQQRFEKRMNMQKSSLFHVKPSQMRSQKFKHNAAINKQVFAKNTQSNDKTNKSLQFPTQSENKDYMDFVFNGGEIAPFSQFKPAPNPHQFYGQFKQEQMYTQDQFNNDVVWPLVEIGMKIHGDDPLWAASFMITSFFDKNMPKDTPIADVDIKKVQQQQDIMNFFSKEPVDIGNFSEGHRHQMHQQEMKTRLEASKSEQPQVQFDFWGKQKWEYDPLKLLNQIPSSQFPFPKIKMNNDENFAGGILEHSDRNILLPSYGN